MSSTDFGDLVLLIGDMNIPYGAKELPPNFKELLATDKINYVLCTGNIGSQECVEMLQSIASNVYIVTGNLDSGIVNTDPESNGTFPEYVVVQIGEFKIGLMHGNQVIPWDDPDSLSQWQRRLDCDILVTGHTHKLRVTESNGKLFLNPGSATGAFSAITPNAPPSFMLMALQGNKVVLYVYDLKDGKTNVAMSEFSK
ncbi:vacuolar protein sorting 29 [Cryptosporidium ryanae]|uniref:vacuolar protein sorting 29 n=1 Tax=Cryptosporidium ryanae TaxID=515981 RepID=UPI00351AAD03|nr:vacuolar protein sorting 29 [Cryptosporidium ryanae]